MFKEQRCLIIEWTKLPKKLKDSIAESYNFHNDCLLPLSTEFSMKGFAKGMSSVKEYMKDQTETNGFEGDIDKFIEDYGLEFDVWLMSRKNIDFTAIDRIMIEVSW